MSQPSFVPGQLYRRRDLHAAFGGSYQSGISFSSKAPVVFLFTGESGHQFGYRDGWQPDRTYHYTGEGQVGDLTFIRGNLAIRAHLDDGRGLYLFERTRKPPGHVRFIGQMIYAGHRLVDGVADRDGTQRRAIVFELAPVATTTEDASATGTESENYEDQLPPVDVLEARISAFGQSRVAELEPEYAPTSGIPAGGESGTSRATRAFVLRRARGHCEGCGAPAPFRRIDGSPYLEPHASRLRPGAWRTRANHRALPGLPPPRPLRRRRRPLQRPAYRPLGHHDADTMTELHAIPTGVNLQPCLLLIR